MSQKNHKFWLIITAVVVGAFGPVLLLAVGPLWLPAMENHLSY